jgi:DNA-binding NarL/FixJ family response regulator
MRHNVLRSTLHHVLRVLFPQAEITEASSGNEGISCIRKSMYPIVIMDNKIPDIPPSELIMAIKNINGSSSFIIYSSMDEQALRKSTPEPGVVGVINETELWTKLPSLLKKLLKTNDHEDR